MQTCSPDKAPIIKGDDHSVNQNTKTGIEEDIIKDICMHKYVLVVIVAMKLM